MCSNTDSVPRGSRRSAKRLPSVAALWHLCGDLTIRPSHSWYPSGGSKSRVISSESAFEGRQSRIFRRENTHNAEKAWVPFASRNNALYPAHESRNGGQVRVRSMSLVGVEPTRPFNRSLDFKSNASAISPQRPAKRSSGANVAYASASLRSHVSKSKRQCNLRIRLWECRACETPASHAAGGRAFAGAAGFALTSMWGWSILMRFPPFHRVPQRRTGPPVGCGN